ncbi:MAG: hypothetical protein N2517_05565 [Ignavibacteria bacterium]|nr:hypothetical protein [Ignavibacteria bacterium]
MKNNFKNLFRNIIFLNAFALLMISCAQPKIVRELPVGNLTRISAKDSPNTKDDEVAPVQRPSNLTIVDQCERETDFFSPETFEGIITSQEFIKREFPETEYNKLAIDYLTSNVEAITFLTSKEGYSAFSHPPAQRYIQRYDLPLSGSVGGTDLFYFYPRGERIFFEVLPKPINSEFWDSHPFVVNDALGNQLLIWASDRPDNFGGFSFPYKNDGNTDLYFAFKRPNQNWNEVNVRNFAEILAGVNTEFFEASPFLFCKCYNPILLFASNRDTKDSTYDIYFVKIEIDFINQKITSKGIVEKLPYGASQINTRADERFPFISYPHISTKNPTPKLYFTSNRNSDSAVFVQKDAKGKETRIILKNVGKYDLYQFELAGVDFKCQPPPPPPPPKLHLVVRLNNYYYNAEGILRDSLINYDGVYLLNKKEQISKKEYELELARKYILEKNKNQLENVSPCDSCFSTSIEFTTPSSIYKDTVIEFTLITRCYEKPSKKISFSMQKGLAFFVTGYWYPTTTENLRELWRRTETGCLSLSKFIDSVDFKPDARHFYLAAAEVNDKWLNEVFYPTIDSLLHEIDVCNPTQKILITVHGYTDPCPLRTIRDQSGRIIQDSTRYSCDESIVFERNDVSILIPSGVLMKEPDLKTTGGVRFKPPLGAQQGNYVLAMLRAYYTKKTIETGFKNKYRTDKKKLELFDKFVVFNLNAFGIYDERPPCPNIDKDIIGIELANKPYPPTLNEPCNLPHSRRAMIYLDVVSTNLIERRVFAREECGSLSYITIVEKRKEEKPRTPKQKVIPIPKPEDLITVIDTLPIPPIPTYDLPSEMPCVGYCYRIVYGKARNIAEFLLLTNFLKSIGFPVDEEEVEGLVLLSKEKFHTIEQAKKTLSEFEKALEQITPIVDITRIKAYIIQI